MHELAHLKEREHGKAFYALCRAHGARLPPARVRPAAVADGARDERQGRAGLRHPTAAGPERRIGARPLGLLPALRPSRQQLPARRSAARATRPRPGAPASGQSGDESDLHARARRRPRLLDAAAWPRRCSITCSSWATQR
ncbi:MAG: DUF45 domain-containing protein [Comamonadaceae bacterium]|nr:DUF45 domain-containing protein [Comamonadaceae bacterium]